MSETFSANAQKLQALGAAVDVAADEYLAAGERVERSGSLAALARLDSAAKSLAKFYLDASEKLRRAKDRYLRAMYREHVRQRRRSKWPPHPDGRTKQVEIKILQSMEIELERESVNVPLARGAASHATARMLCERRFNLVKMRRRFLDLYGEECPHYQPPKPPRFIPNSQKFAQQQAQDRRERAAGIVRRFPRRKPKVTHI